MVLYTACLEEFPEALGCPDFDVSLPTPIPLTDLTVLRPTVGHGDRQAGQQ